MNEFLEMRKDSLGGSDIAALLGFDDFRGPLAVYMEKKGLYSQPENEFMRMGKELEPIIIAKYQSQAGTPVRRNSKLHKHRKHSWIHATPDAFTVPKKIGIEAKSRIIFLAHKYGEVYYPRYPMERLPLADEIRPSEMCQTQLCMEVTGLREWHLAVYFGGAEFRIYRVAYDKVLVELMLEAANDFWQNAVLKDDPPEIDSTRWSDQYLKDTYPEASKDLLEPTPEIQSMIFQYRNAKNEKDDAEKVEKMWKNRLIEACGEHAGIKGMFSYASQRGKVSYSKVVEELGATPEQLEAHRGAPFRKFNIFK